MAKKPPEGSTPDVDIVELFTKLTAGNIPMAIDPATALFNFGTAALLLVGKIIDTVPPEQHAENWDRLDKFIDRLERVFKPGGAT